MAIRAALNVARWLPFALVVIIKMHYNPTNPRKLPASSLYLVATGSFPLEDEPLIFPPPSFPPFVSFGEPTVPSAIYSLCRGELHPCCQLFLSPSRFSSIPPAPPAHRRCQLRERGRKSLFLLLPLFNLSSPLLKERRAFHSQTRPCLSRLDQRRTFRHLINPPTGVPSR